MTVVKSKLRDGGSLRLLGIRIRKNLEQSGFGLFEVILWNLPERSDLNHQNQNQENRSSSLTQTRSLPTTKQARVDVSMHKVI
jgi:hypothetical protein